MEDEILQEFVIESTEALDQLDVELIELEQDPESTATLSSIFRRVHTIKGTCGFLGFGRLEHITHVGENLLSKLRDGEMVATAQIVTTLLELVDAMREMMDHIVANGEEGPGEYPELLEKLTAHAEGREPELDDAADADEEQDAAVGLAGDPAEAVGSTDATAVGTAEQDGAATAAADSADAPATEHDATATEHDEATATEHDVAAAAASDDAAAATTEQGDPTAEQDDATAEQDESHGDQDSWTEGWTSKKLGDILVEAGQVSEGDIDRALTRQQDGDPRHVGEILVGWGLLSPDEALEAIEEQQRQAAAAASSSSVADSSIRVDVELLDTLMNLVGELVLNRNQILQHTKDTSDAALVATLQRLDLITTELQGSVMQTRMQPIENAWAKYPRVVRDLARMCGKEVGLEMQGKETELDKTLLEAIKDPLTHVVRNAVDHGIEDPETRESRGKPRKGTLSLHAFHESGQVIIEISDDGGGIDPYKIRDLAIDRDVISEARADKLSRREMTELIFAPGFSTAEAVSNISGRGVGMDVVRTNIEQIGGTVDLQSELGVGTTLRVKIPLTLAIIPALIVRSGDHDFAIPQVSLLELVRLQHTRDQIETVHGAPVYRLRGKLLPLVFLNQQLDRDPVESTGDHIVVLQSGERTFGLVVDDVEDTAEIVVKPLGKQLRDLPVFAGATIMGDGQVALILDVVGLAGRAGINGDGRGADHRMDAEDEAVDAEAQTLLLFRLGTERTFALHLSQVARLEEFDPSTIERSGDFDVVQYRDHILPLVHMADALEGGRRGQPDTDEAVRAIVYRRGDQDVGLVVDRIADIVHERLTVTRDSDAPGLSGSAVIGGVVTDVVDIDAVLARFGVLDPVPA